LSKELFVSATTLTEKMQVVRYVFEAYLLNKRLLSISNQFLPVFAFGPMPLEKSSHCK
jgi:hypothetical protein